MKNPLQVFLYVLMRDHLPTGTVVNIINNHVHETNDKDPVFSSTHLAEYALDLSKRLLDGSIIKNEGLLKLIECRVCHRHIQRWRLNSMAVCGDCMKK